MSELTQAEAPKRPGRNFRVTEPAVPEQNPLDTTPDPRIPPPDAATRSRIAQAEAEMKGGWKEPDFEGGDHPPAIDYEPPELNLMRDKVFKRKDQPDSEKRYLVTGVYPSWDASIDVTNKQGKLTSNDGNTWVIHVNIFHFGEREANGKRKRINYTTGRYRPSGADIPAETFKSLFEMDVEGTQEVPHSFQTVS
jgi:hypothetical protein